MASKIINMTVPEDLVKQMDKVAKAEGRTRSELFREAARRYLLERRAVKRESSSLLSRLRTLAVKGPNFAAPDIDRLLYPNKSRR